MAENSGDLSLGYMMGQSDSGGGNGGFGDMGGIWGILALVLILGMVGGYGGGGLFGGGLFGGGGGQALTRAELYDGFAIQNIDAAVRGVQNGISDSTYAITGALTSGFHGVDSAICNLGYNVQGGFNTLGHQISDCCCTTQRAIDGVNYNMATQINGLGTAVQSSIRDAIDNQNANFRSMMDFMVGEKLAAKDAKIAELQNQVSQANQNAVIQAAISASTAEIIRRTGNDCPVPSYLVQPPTPVNFPVNGCGTVQFGGGYGGCGCGC